MTLTLVTIAALAVLFAVAALATVPPRLVPWPDYRSTWTDVAKLRVYLANRISADRTRERDEARETGRRLRGEVAALKDRNADLRRRLAAAETRIYALQEMALPEALALVAAHRDRTAGDADEGGDETGRIGGAPPPAFKP